MDRDREDLVNSQPVRCPRCGYDQRGVTAAWRESCPLHGVCSECGLRFRWAELFLSERFEPRWCVEYANPWLRAPLACFGTLARSFLPWRFWARLSMAYRIRPGRLVLYVVFLLLLPALMYVPYQTARAVMVRRAVLNRLASQAAFVKQSVASCQSMLNTLMSSASSADPQIQQQIQSLQGTLNSMQSQATVTATISHSLFRSVLEAVFTPWRTTSSTTIVYSSGTIAPYPAPANYSGTLALGQAITYSQEMEARLRVLVSVLMSTLLILLLPIAFILLPVSRRRAKVRWAHLWRIAAYSGYIPIIVAIVCLVGYNLSLIGVTWPILARIEQNMALATLIFVPIWWIAAIRHYLKMPHAMAVAVLLTFMLALILSPLVLAAAPPWVEKAIFGW